MKRLLFISMAFVTAVPAFARRPFIPLLPPRESASVLETRRTERTVRKTRSAPTQLGFEFGSILRTTGSGSDLLGIQLMMGGRIAMRLRPWPYIYLRPSLGYFRKSESAGNVTVAQNLFEAGLNAQYGLSSQRDIKVLIGISQRFDGTFTATSVGETGQGSPWLFRYRAGPSAGISFRMNDSTTLTADAEYTFGLTRPLRNFGGASVGLLFDI
jgi:hypothetical protein